ncbi:MAG: hypothetical protein WA766_04195, partial [Candidatus Acidiferrales bacterium]
MRMIQGGGSAGFALEALECLTIIGHVVRQEFQRDVAAQALVLGLVHHAHSTATKLFKDAIVGNRSAGEWRRIGHSREFYAAPNGKSTKANFLLASVGKAFEF